MAQFSETFRTFDPKHQILVRLNLILLCAVLILAGCKTDVSSDWEELRNQANELYNGQQFDEALRLYEQALEKADADGRLTLRQDIIDCHLAMDDDREARKLLADLMTEAHDSGDKQAEAEAAYTLGEQLYKADDHEKGFAYMHEAVRLMEQVTAETGSAKPDYHQAMTLAYFHHGLMKWYCEDKTYPQAIAHSKAVEQVMLPLGDEDQARKFRRVALSTRAYIYMLTDSVAQAEAAYHEWQQLLPCLNLTEERDICPYYIESGHYQEALEIYSRYEPWILKTKGYWSGKERMVCGNMAEIYALMGQSDSAYSRLLKAYEIRDTLYARQSEANAQELEAVYQNQQKSEQIQRQRIWILTLLTVLAVIAVTMLTVRLRRLRKQKNQAIVDIAKNMTDADPGATRFATFDRTIEQGRLYTQPDLTREMLADLMGVDRTTFSRIIQEQSGCKNLRDYLNQKRMCLAEEMLRQHPDYTIEAIAHDCGLTLTTFKRLCKDMHNMSPSDYRKSLLQ